jgi:hypothetical protein
LAEWLPYQFGQNTTANNVVKFRRSFTAFAPKAMAIAA